MGRREQGSIRVKDRLQGREGKEAQRSLIESWVILGRHDQYSSWHHTHTPSYTHTVRHKAQTDRVIHTHTKHTERVSTHKPCTRTVQHHRG